MAYVVHPPVKSKAPHPDTTHPGWPDWSLRLGRIGAVRVSSPHWTNMTHANMHTETPWYETHVGVS